MKKILSIILVMLMLVAFVGCGEAKPTGDQQQTTAQSTSATQTTEVVEPETPETLKFGVGIDAQYGEVASADGDVNGSGEIVANIAVVLVDNDGKIVKCEIDTVDFIVEYTSAGEAVAPEEFKTKYELGDAYGMKAYAGAAKEWYEQVDAFEQICAGKTIDEVKALLVDGYKGNDEVVSAGCTIGIAEFVVAVEKAVNNAADSDATANDTLGIGVETVADLINATEDAEGAVELEINIAAAAVDADAKAVVMFTDVVPVTFTFDAKGAATTDTATAIVSKAVAGDAYGMKAYGADLNGDGVVLEWYEQSEAFNVACLGKNADEIAALAVNGYGVESVQTAGCTIAVSGLVNAAVKATK